MRREGLTSMDYMEQLSWLLFLKSFEETENNLEAETAYASADSAQATAGPTTTVSPVTCSPRRPQRLPGAESCGRIGLNENVQRGAENQAALERLWPSDSS